MQCGIKYRLNIYIHCTENTETYLFKQSDIWYNSKSYFKIRSVYFTENSGYRSLKNRSCVTVFSSRSAGVGNYFTRRARFGKTVEAAGRTQIGKQGEDLFFFGDHSPRTSVIFKIRGFYLVFYSNFAPLKLIF